MRTTIGWLGISTVSLCAALTVGQQAIASTLSNSWNYAIDSFTDGVAGSTIGGTAYEIYGIAFQETSDRIQVAINTNMPLSGVTVASAQNGSIALGDLFFNFSGQDFNTASSEGNLFAVRFVPTNDSGVGLGIFGNVVAKSVTAVNSGFNDLTSYASVVQNGGGSPFLGDLPITDPYFAPEEPILNVIDTGTFLGNVGGLDATDLNFAQFGAAGSQTLGFSFDKSYFPSGSFIASLFEECANDGVALQKSRSVPEPSDLAGLATVGLLLAGVRRRKAQTHQTLQEVTRR